MRFKSEEVEVSVLEGTIEVIAVKEALEHSV